MTKKYKLDKEGNIVPEPSKATMTAVYALTDEAETLREAVYSIQSALREAGSPSDKFPRKRRAAIEKLLSQIDGATVELEDALDDVMDADNDNERIAELLNEVATDKCHKNTQYAAGLRNLCRVKGR